MLIGISVTACSPSIMRALTAAETTPVCDPTSATITVGSGTVSDPYLICSVPQFKLIVTGKNYRLDADLDLTAVNMAATNLTLGGEFNGNSHKISNLSLNSAGLITYGLFTTVTSAGSIHDLTLKNFTVALTSISSTYVGLLAGTNQGTIYNVLVQNPSLQAWQSELSSTGTGVGAVVGLNKGTIYSTASTGGSVLADASSGGLVGHNQGQIFYSYSTSAVNGDQNAGGLVGLNDIAGYISDSYATGTVTAGNIFWLVGTIGGFVGENDGIISRAYSSGAVVDGGISSSFGGFVGITNYVVAQNGTTDHSFWDTTGSGQALDNNGASGLTAVQMNSNNQALFPTWDFVHVWQVTLGAHPTLGTHSDPCSWFLADFTHGGTGTMSNPFVIKTASELDSVRNGLYCRYVLGGDIDLNLVAFNPINNFVGSLDGQNHVIKNWSFNSAGGTNVGIFGSVSGAAISNLGVTNVTITGTGTSVGALVGKMTASTVDNSYATGTITGDSYIGGLVGTLGSAGDSTAVVSNSNSTATVQASNGATDYAGGLIGYSYGTISNSYSSGGVTAAPGGRYVGGLLGYADTSSMITHSHATGTVGVAGADGYVGGLVGLAKGSITKSYATGIVSGTRYVGGLTGVEDGTIIDSYATGAVNASVDSGGGLVGDAAFGASTITRCFAAGVVGGAGNLGGLIGFIGGSVTSTASFWDTATTTQAGSASTETGEITANMQNPATYPGSWDFVNVWNSPSPGNYPTLR